MKKNKRFLWMLLAVVVLIALRLGSIPFTDEGDWSVNEFLFGSIILLLLVVILEAILRMTKDKPRRRWIILAIFVLTLLLWAEMGVGIFGTPLAGE